MEAYKKWIEIMKEFREFMKNHPKLNKIESEDPLLYTDDIFDDIICRLEDIIRGDGMCTLSNKERIQILNEMSSFGTCNISIEEDYKKKYEEAIKILKDFHDESASFSVRTALETLYPEFKESRDEKIRKRLIEFFKDWGKTRSYCWSIYIPDILAWLEKQSEEQSIIRWHSINEEPEEMKELFCEWESDDATWHDVAFYNKESHAFRHAKMPIRVTKWVYVDELLEKQSETYTNSR